MKLMNKQIQSLLRPGLGPHRQLSKRLAPPLRPEQPTSPMRVSRSMGTRVSVVVLSHRASSLYLRQTFLAIADFIQHKTLLVHLVNASPRWVTDTPSTLPISLPTKSLSMHGPASPIATTKDIPISSKTAALSMTRYTTPLWFIPHSS